MDGRVFCVHGGLSPNLQGIDQVSFFVELQSEAMTACTHRSVPLTANKRFLMTVPCVIYYGQIPMVSFYSTVTVI